MTTFSDLYMFSLRDANAEMNYFCVKCNAKALLNQTDVFRDGLSTGIPLQNSLG